MPDGCEAFASCGFRGFPFLLEEESVIVYGYEDCICVFEMAVNAMAGWNFGRDMMRRL
jgi:hypothetical protein